MYGKKPAAKPAMPAQATAGMARKPATAGAGAAKPAMPSQANKGGATRGLARAAQMSGRTMPTAGKPATMPAQAQKGMTKRPSGRGM